jgi:TP901-1 family phage major tail protein
MTAQRGRDMILKLQQAGGSFVTISGLRTRRILLNSEPVDTTHRESVKQWRELLVGGGMRRASVTGEGVFRDQPSDALLKDIFFGTSIVGCQLILPDFGQIDGPFQVTSLEFKGAHEGELKFEVTLESAGVIVFTAL